MLWRTCIVQLVVAVWLGLIPVAYGVTAGGGQPSDARQVLGRKAARVHARFRARLHAVARFSPTALLRVHQRILDQGLRADKDGGPHQPPPHHQTGGRDHLAAPSPPEQAVAATAQTLTAEAFSPAAPSTHAPGAHAAEYLAVAATARFPLVGKVTYDFTSHAHRATSPVPGSATPPPPSLRPLRIAQYSHVYGPSAVWSGNFTGCDRPCTAIGAYGNASAAAEADVVIVNLMQPATPWVRPPGQLWVGTYFESPDHYAPLRNARLLAQFNYTSGYRPDADFPVFNMVRDTAKWLDKTRAWPLPTFAAKRARPMLATWVSNCVLDGVGRLPLLAELARHNVSVASYGKCGPNQATPGLGADMDPRWREWAATNGLGAEKAAVSAQHLFLYAAENSGCAYYTTEKVFHGLVAGSVPVYVGDAASLKKLAPPGSVIYAADFESAADLASHLRHLATNRTAYEQRLAWRTDPASMHALNQYMSLPVWEASNQGSRACALCEFLWASPRRVRPATAHDLCRALRK